MGNYEHKKFSEEDEKKLKTGKNLNTGKRSTEYPELTELEVEFARRSGSNCGLERSETETQIREVNDANKPVLKVCRLCNGSFMTKESWRDTCAGCSDKPMYPDSEAANEALCH